MSSLIPEDLMHLDEEEERNRNHELHENTNKYDPEHPRDATNFRLQNFYPS